LFRYIRAISEGTKLKKKSSEFVKYRKKRSGLRVVGGH